MTQLYTSSQSHPSPVVPKDSGRQRRTIGEDERGDGALAITLGWAMGDGSQVQNTFLPAKKPPRLAPAASLGVGLSGVRIQTGSPSTGLG